jgi:hypothetical protein
MNSLEDGYLDHKLEESVIELFTRIITFPLL